MKNLLLINLGLIALLGACAEEKFAEKRAASVVGDGGGTSNDPQEDDANASPKGTITVDVSDGGKGKDGDTASEDGKSDEGAGGTDSASSGSSKDDKSKGKSGACAAAVNAERVKVSGSLNQQTLAIGDAYYLKVTGNQNKIVLELKSDVPTAKIPGICLEIAGNMNEIEVKSAIAVGTVLVWARGNQAKVNIDVAKDSVIDSIKFDAAGNQPLLSIKGDGKYPCAMSDLKGNGASVNCVAKP